MPTRDASSGGRWIALWKIRSRWLPCAWLSRAGSFSLAWSITPTAARSTPVAATRTYSKKTEMSRKGNPWDNAACESFMKTLKYEEVFRSEYRDLQEALLSIREFLEKIYNQKRLHSALGYLPPAEFERNHKEAAARQLPL